MSKCYSKSNQSQPSSFLFNVDATTGDPPVQSPPRTIISGGLLRFTSDTVTITTSGGPPGTSIVNLETESLVIGPTGPTGSPGVPGPQGPAGAIGPTGPTEQVGAAVEWFSGQYFGGLVPAASGATATTGPTGSFGFLVHDGSIQPIKFIMEPVNNPPDNFSMLITPKIFTGTVTQFQITLQGIISFNPSSGAFNTITVIVLYYPFLGNPPTYGPPDTIGTFNLNIPNLPAPNLTQVVYGNINTTPTNINPGDVLGVYLTDNTPSATSFTTSVTSYYAVAS